MSRKAIQPDAAGIGPPIFALDRVAIPSPPETGARCDRIVTVFTRRSEVARRSPARARLESCGTILRGDAIDRPGVTRHVIIGARRCASRRCPVELAIEEFVERLCDRRSIVAV